MQTRLMDSSQLCIAAELIQKGETVVFPTETVYGLGADATNPDAVLKIFAAKNRPADNPLIVHIASLDMMPVVTRDFHPMAQRLARAFMPGPITLVLQKSAAIPSVVSAGLETVGVRFPKHEIAREFIRLCKTPIAAPSANVSGGVSATTFGDVERELRGKVAGIIRGEDCEFGIESTVVDVTKDAPVILRPGSITWEMLREVVPSARLHPSLLTGAMQERPASPGMKYTHYSPNAEVILVYGESAAILAHFEKHLGEEECLFLFLEEYDRFSHNKMLLGSRRDLNEMAHNIFKSFKQADRLGYKRVYVPAVAEEGIGFSIMNRLKKSSGGKVMYV